MSPKPETHGRDSRATAWVAAPAALLLYRGFQPADPSPPPTLRNCARSADWKSAIQQVGNLRHVQGRTQRIRGILPLSMSGLGLSNERWDRTIQGVGYRPQQFRLPRLQNTVAGHRLRAGVEHD